MTRRTNRMVFVAALIAAFAPAPMFAQKVKVVQFVSTDLLESTFKELGIAFKKQPSPVGGFDYVFTRNAFNIRVHYFNGQDLWIDTSFVKILPEEVNRWNRQARLSRAVSISGPFGPTVSLEAQLPCAGGVTTGMIRQFITGFDKEVQNYTKFLRERVQEEEEIKKVSAAHLERLMHEFKLEFKTSGDEKELRLDFTIKQHKIQMTCHEGTVLVLRSTYGKMPLEKINKYNTERHYVRACVDTGPDGKEFTALEMYLDCRGGVTESILRNFLRRFDEELKFMDQFVTI